MQKKTSKRRNKLEHNTYHGIFLGYTASQKIATYMDKETGKIKIASNVTYDKAGMTMTPHSTPLSAIKLQHLGYSN